MKIFRGLTIFTFLTSCAPIFQEFEDDYENLVEQKTELELKVKSDNKTFDLESPTPIKD